MWWCAGAKGDGPWGAHPKEVRGEGTRVWAPGGGRALEPLSRTPTPSILDPLKGVSGGKGV